MSLKDKVVRALALRWARGKVKDLRGKERETAMGKVLKYLDGWKLVLSFVIIVGSGVYDQSTGGNSAGIVAAVLALLQWGTDPANSGIDGATATTAVAAISALIAIGHKLVKAHKQSKAGADVSELLSTGGYVTQFVDEGKIPVKDFVAKG